MQLTLASSVQVSSVADALPMAPVNPAAAVQLLQWFVATEPLVCVPVHTPKFPPLSPPFSVTLIGARSDPSRRSVQELAIVVPLTSLYGPGDGVKRELAALVLSEIHALNEPDRPAAAARFWQIASALFGPPKLTG